MKTDNLDTALEELKVTIKEDLIKTLNAKGHKGEGKLEKSIRIDIRHTGDEYKLSIEAFQYLLYLDNGKFYTDWFKRMEDKINEEIADALLLDVIDNLNI